MSAVRGFAREQATESGMSPDQREQVAAAVEQAFASALASPASRPLEVRLLVTDGRVEVEFLPAPQAGDRAPQQIGWSESFSDWLAGELRERGLSQEAAARRIGVSLKTVSRWVRGETEPRYRELALIQRALGDQPITFPAGSSGQA